ncbi:hypothetical protein [Gordonia sp. (in: high G+C Gram-positive bacteria)]|uniref:hypothetical protein n=1 Tax=Gordonia sp. (in: high G+C Gram-positive bacteria) TaxID=84139 RepID=UPI0039E6F39E
MHWPLAAIAALIILDPRHGHWIADLMRRLGTMITWRCPVCHRRWTYKNTRRGRAELADVKAAHGQ